MKFAPHRYQERMIDFLVGTPAAALFVDMGLGKTVTTLTAIDRLMYDSVETEKVLVIAPKSVALNTWSGETEKWDHLRNLRLSIVMGTEAQRRAALQADADIYVTNRDNVVWLVGQYFDGHRLRFTSPWPFDTVVLDESSSFKNPQSKRYRALLRVRPFISRIILLTGTPAPNGLMDLWAQVRLLDGGKRLGKFITQYREAYFHPGAHNGAVVYEYLPNAGAKEKIADKISDICLSMQASDYLEMPKVIDGGMDLQLDCLKQYRKFEKDCIMTLKDGGEIEAVTAVALTNKLLQFSSGAVYDDEHSWHPVSSTKIDALSDLLEQTSEPVLVYYNYPTSWSGYSPSARMRYPSAVKARYYRDGMMAGYRCCCVIRPRWRTASTCRQEGISSCGIPPHGTLSCTSRPTRASTGRGRPSLWSSTISCAGTRWTRQ